MTDRLKLSLAMIVRDHCDELVRCLTSVAPVVDEIVLVLDKRSSDLPRLHEIAGQFGAEAFEYGWETDSFADARNLSFELCTGDYILWLDADDVVVNPEALRAFSEARIAEGHNVLVLPYDYKQSASGACECWLERERVIQRDTLRWVGVVHESCREQLLPVREYRVPEGADTGFRIVHDHNDGSSFGRYKRVHDRLSRKAELGEEYEVRDYYYLGVSSVGTGKLEEAEKWWGKVAYESKWPDGDVGWVYLSRCHIGDIYHNTSRFREAITHYMAATECLTGEALAWTRIAESYRMLGNIPLSAHYSEVALSKHKILAHMSIDPRVYDFFPLRAIGLSQAQANEFKDAHATLSKADEIDFDLSVRTALKRIEFAFRQNDLMTAFGLVSQSVNGSSTPIPPEILGHESFGERTYDKDAVAILNLQGTPLWPRARQNGCGGAEESLLNFSRTLAARGHKVRLYTALDGPPFRVGENALVLPIEHIQKDKPYKAAVIWREPKGIELFGEVGKKVLWLQDLVDPGSIDPSAYDAIACVSDDHAARYKGLCDAKSIGHLLVKDEFTARSPVRNPYHCIYTSRHERGLLTLLKLWPRILEHHPQARLSVFAPNDIFHRTCVRGDGEYRESVHEINKLLDTLDGVTHYTGAVTGQGTIADVSCTAGVWLYPTDFIETFCISGAKCQAAGLYPVANCIGALETTVHPDYQFVAPESGDDRWDAWVDMAVKYIGRDVQEERDDLAQWAEQFDISHAVSKMEEVI